MAKFELVIFDCDGVLVDSEPIANRVLALMLAELGLHLSEHEIFENFVGYSDAHCFRVMESMLGRPLPENFRGDFQDRTFAAFRTELRATTGVREALDRLQQPFCVASSGDHAKMRTTLGITGLLPRFEGKLFSVTQVARGKPAPDVYLYAAAQCGVEPQRCIVVEDTPPGVKAGAAAGMKVFGFCAHTPKEMLLDAGAHLTFDQMSVLPELVRDP